MDTDDFAQRPPRTQEKTLTAQSRAMVSGEVQVVRGLNDTRLAILGIILSIALTVAFGVRASLWIRILLGVGVFGGIAVASHVVLSRERPTHVVMAFAHWVLGRKH